MNLIESTQRMFDLIEGDGPTCAHRCPECGDTFGCYGPEGCQRPESALCPDCDAGRERPLACGHLPGGCQLYPWKGGFQCINLIRAGVER